MRVQIPARRGSSCVRSAIVAALTLIAGVAAVTPAAAVELVPEAAVRHRADQRWQAMVDGKYEDAYKYLAPGYRAVQSYKTYSSGFASSAWTGGKAVRVECNDERDRCAVTVRVDSRVFMPGLKMPEGPGSNVTTYFEENWIKQDNAWWLFPQS